MYRAVEERKKELGLIRATRGSIKREGIARGSLIVDQELIINSNRIIPR